MISKKKLIQSIAGAALILGTMLFVSACSNAATADKTAEPAKKEIQLLKELPQPKSMTVDPAWMQVRQR